MWISRRCFESLRLMEEGVQPECGQQYQGQVVPISSDETSVRSAIDIPAGEVR